MPDGRNDGAAQVVAAIDRLAAATLAAALVSPGDTSEKVSNTYQGVLAGVIREDRDLEAKFKQLEEIMAKRTGAPSS